MAHIKTGGKVKQRGNVAGKRLGLKVTAGEKVSVGNILVRQRGTKYHPGVNVAVGRDHTLFSLKEGTVQFGNRRGDTIVEVIE